MINEKRRKQAQNATGEENSGLDQFPKTEETKPLILQDVDLDQALSFAD